MVGLVAPAQSARRGPARTLTLALALASVCLAAAGPAEAQRPRAGALPERELLPAASNPRSEKPPAPAATASAPTPLLPPYVDAARSFFDGTVLHDIQITMKPGDWETLKANYMTDTYYPADFQWRGVKVPMIGIRSRGNVSRNPRKPSLRLDFNRYLTEQKFLKLSALVLANAVQDATMLNNRLAMMVFSALELPAPRVVHARLFVNGEYVGLYQAVEAIEKAFLARAFGFDSKGKRRDDGYLFEYRWVQGWHWTYLGPIPRAMPPCSRSRRTNWRRRRAVRPDRGHVPGHQRGQRRRLRSRSRQVSQPPGVHPAPRRRTLPRRHRWVPSPTGAPTTSTSTASRTAPCRP